MCTNVEATESSVKKTVPSGLTSKLRSLYVKVNSRRKGFLCSNLAGDARAELMQMVAQVPHVVEHPIRTASRDR
jgi:hypothetical protein